MLHFGDCFVVRFCPSKTIYTQQTNDLSLDRRDNCSFRSQVANTRQAQASQIDAWPFSAFTLLDSISNFRDLICRFCRPISRQLSLGRHVAFESLPITFVRLGRLFRIIFRIAIRRLFICTKRREKKTPFGRRSKHMFLTHFPQQSSSCAWRRKKMKVNCTGQIKWPASNDRHKPNKQIDCVLHWRLTVQPPLFTLQHVQLWLWNQFHFRDHHFGLFTAHSPLKPIIGYKCFDFRQRSTDSRLATFFLFFFFSFAFSHFVFASTLVFGKCISLIRHEITLGERKNKRIMHIN